MSALAQVASMPEPDCWRPLRHGDGVYLDVKGCSRLTIRPAQGGGFALKINGEFVATFPTIDQAKTDAAKRAAPILSTKVELDAWYASAFGKGRA